jgi:hypothetical protein
MSAVCCMWGQQGSVQKEERSSCQVCSSYLKYNYETRKRQTVLWWSLYEGSCISIQGWNSGS